MMANTMIRNENKTVNTLENQPFRKDLKILLLIYGLCVAVRFVFACLTSQQTRMAIDELLYASIGRSIGLGEGILFRGQQADYSYLIYPALLSPVYALFPDGTNFFRILQLLSILMMQLSIFPIHALNLELLHDHREALTITCLCMLLPDFIFGEILFSECVVYPLFFLCALLVYRQLKASGSIRAIGIGVIAGLLYECKPGHIAFPAAALGVMLVSAWMNKQKKALIHVGISTVSLLFFLGLYRLMVPTSAAFSIYQQQVSFSFDHMDRFIRGIVLTFAFFILGCGGGCLLLPLSRMKDFRKHDRLLLISLLLAMGATHVGTAWTINRYAYERETIHLRYMAMYIPLMLMMTALCREEGTSLRKKDDRRMILSALLILWLLIAEIVFGMSRSVAGETAVASFSMSLFSLVKEPGTALILFILLVSGIAAFCVLYYKERRKLKRIALTMAAALFLFSNLTSYISLGMDGANCAQTVQYAAEALKAIDGEEYLYIYTDDSTEGYSNIAGALSVNTRQNASFISFAELFNQMSNTGGIYVPFVPVIPERGVINDRETVDTDTVVLDRSAYSMLQLSDNTRSYLLSDESLKIVKLTEGQRWADSMLANVNDFQLKQGVKGILAIFDPEILRSPLQVTLEVEADQDTVLTMHSEREIYTADLHPGTGYVTFVFHDPSDFYNLYAEDCTIRVNGYSLSNE